MMDVSPLPFYLELGVRTSELNLLFFTKIILKLAIDISMRKIMVFATQAVDPGKRE